MRNLITVVIPSSPIKSHPSTRIIDETINSVRHHLPDCEIILQMDGVRPQQKEYTDRYNEYKTEILWRCLHKWHNVLPVIFDNVQHQSGMMHRTIDKVKTPLILYVEQDAPLVTIKDIDWQKCVDFITNGQAYNIRFHFEDSIPVQHKDLMIDGLENGFQKTIQWSQRPHLSTTGYYKNMLKYFPIDAESFIEDFWYGKVLQDFYASGMMGWFEHRLWIYHPEGGIKRSYTNDGREGDPKFGEGFRIKK